MKNKNNFTDGPILSPLLKFSIPILFAIFLQAMYGAVDLIIVGQFGDSSGVSAVATGGQIMQIITGIISGLTMGTTVLLAQKIGAKDDDGAAKTIGSSICIFAFITIILTITLLLSSHKLALLINTPPEALEKTINYTMICSAGLVFIVAYNVISGILRGIGNSKLPLIFVSIASIANILGDLILVGFFNLDAIGAAIATVFSQALSVVLSIFIIRKRNFPFTFSKPHIKFHRFETKKILQLGSPIALQDALTNISFLIITAIVNTLGLVASAAVGISEKIVIFIMLIPMAYMSSISAFTAQNVGANKVHRAKSAMLYGMATSSALGVIMFYISYYHGNILASIFSNDIAVINACTDYMRAYAIDCLLVSFLFCFMGYFNGCGQTLFVMIQGLLAAFLIRIPFSYFASNLDNATMFEIGLASPIATALSILLCIAYFIYANKKPQTIINH